MRLSSWDFITNPASILFGMSSPFANISGHLQVYTVTLMFFILIGLMYVVMFSLLQIFNRSRLQASEPKLAHASVDRIHR
jgi:uncharacterized membrane protein